MSHDKHSPVSCCEAISAALATFSIGVAEASLRATQNVAINFPDDPVQASTRLAAAFAAALQIGTQVRAALQTLAEVECPTACCASAAQAIAEIGVATINNVVTSAVSPAIPLQGELFNLTIVIGGLLQTLAANIQLALLVSNQTPCRPCHGNKKRH